MSDYFFQIVLFLLGAILSVVTVLIKPAYQKWAAGALSVLLIAFSSGWAGYEIGKRQLVQETSYTVPIFASTFPIASTGILVEKGDQVQIVVQGDDANWFCSSQDNPYKANTTSAEGLFGVRNEKYLVPSANQCELVGYIQGGNYFRVGAYEQFETTETGFLFLGANDDTSCDWNCYSDNSGTLTVKITVRKQ